MAYPAILLSQSEINAQMLPWTDREFTRFAFRQALLTRRGMGPDEAEAWADRLALRDQQRDDRRLCIECTHLQRSGGCFAAAQGWIHGATKDMTPIKDRLQRCERFEWVKP